MSNVVVLVVAAVSDRQEKHFATPDGFAYCDQASPAPNSYRVVVMTDQIAKYMPLISCSKCKEVALEHQNGVSGA
jgi:hypothetical protein